MKTDSKINNLIKEFSHYYFQDKHAAISTCEQYENILNYFFDFVSKEIEEITRENINSYTGELKEKGLSINTIRLRQVAIRMFFEWYVKYINPDYPNPAANLLLFREEIKIPEILSPEDIMQMVYVQDISKFIGRRNAALICLLADTGIRKSEAAALKMGHVKLMDNNFLLSVPRIKSFERPIPFAEIDENNFLAGYFSMYWQEMKFSKLFKDSDPLFITDGPLKKNTPLNADGIVEIVKSAAKKANIEKRVTVHSFRHFYGTYMYINGTDIMRIKELMGHALLDTTQRYINIAHNIEGIVLKTGIRKSMTRPPKAIGDFAKILKSGRIKKV